MATRDNLNIRRIHLGSGTCVLCGTNDETVSHLFFRCKVAIHILQIRDFWIYLSQQCKNTFKRVWWYARRKDRELMFNLLSPVFLLDYFLLFLGLNENLVLLLSLVVHVLFDFVGEVHEEVLPWLWGNPITFFLFIVVILLKRTCIWNVWFISKFFNLLNMLAYFVCFVVGIYYYAWEEKMFQVIILDNGKTHSFVDICICRYNVCILLYVLVKFYFANFPPEGW